MTRRPAKRGLDPAPQAPIPGLRVDHRPRSFPGLRRSAAVFAILLVGVLLAPGGIGSAPPGATTVHGTARAAIAASVAPPPHDPGRHVVAPLSARAWPATPGPLVSVASADDWPSYLHDSAHSSANLNESVLNVASAATIHPLWDFLTNGSGMNRTVVAEPVVAAGTVYVGAWNGYEYALNESTGVPRWSTYLGQAVSPNCTPAYRGITSTATVVGNTVYVGGGDSYWYALNAANGSVRWKVLIGNTSDGYYNWASPAVLGNTAYVGVSSNCDNPLIRGAVDEVNLLSHNVARISYTVGSGSKGGSVWSSPTIDPASDSVYATTGNGLNPASTLIDAIVQLNRTTLNLTAGWQIPAGQQQHDGDFGAGPTLAYDAEGRALVVAVNKNGWLYAWNATNVSLGPRWADQIAVSAACPECGLASIAPAAYDGSRLYAGTALLNVSSVNYSGSVEAIDPSSGALLWRHFTPGPVVGAVTASAGLVVVAAGTYLELLDAANGTLLSETKLLGPSWSAPAIADGCVFLGTTNGTVSAFGSPGSACAPPASPKWVFLPQTTAPSSRDRSMMVFDGALRTVVMFGGRGSSGALGDTWEFRNGNWSAVPTVSAPAPRWGAAYTYDPATGAIVLFGGTDGSSTFGDTWVFNGTWTNITSTLFVAPSARSGAAFGFDQVLAVLVLFGGENVSGALGDTWELSNGMWIPGTPLISPPPRWNATLSRETPNGSLFLFGGINGSGGIPDLWRFSSTTWVSLQPAGLPPLRGNATVSIDGQVPSVILFGGDGPSSSPRPVLSDTWSLVRGEWLPTSPLTSPTARSSASSAFDARDHYLVLFGGNTAAPSGPATLVGDTWGYAPLITGNVSANRTTVDVGGSVGFSINLAGGFGPITSSWTFGDGGRAPGRAQPTHTFASPGLFVVHAWGNDSVGQSLPLTITIQVGAALNATLTASPKSLDTGQTTYLNETIVGGSAPYRYAYTGLPTGCVTSSTPSLVCQPTGNGTFFVKANVTDRAGTTIVAGSVKLRVATAPQLTLFQATPTATDAGEPVGFDLEVAFGLAPIKITYHNLPIGCANSTLGPWSCRPSVPGPGPATFPVSATLVDANGATIVTPTIDLTVYPALQVTATVAPKNVTLGSGQNYSSVWWNVSVSGGVPPYAVVLRTTDLPLQCKAGNSTINQSGGTFSTQCAPRAQGTFNATFSATDQLGIRVVVTSANLSVNPANSTTPGIGGTPPAKTGPFGGHLYEYVAIGFVALLVVIELILLLRQRGRGKARNRPPPAAMDVPEE
jgi:outer membrane protein assembly factor BamB